MSLLSLEMSADRIAKLKDAALAHDDPKEAWRLARPLLKGVRQAEAARALADLTRRGAFELADGLVAAQALLDAAPEDAQVMGLLGRAFESLHDIRYLNGAPPTTRVLLEIADRLQDLVDSAGAASRDDELALHHGLSVAARILGRSWDDVAERSERWLVEANGARWTDLYGLGLFYKTRGRFQEGLAANQRAFDSGGAEDDAVRWNLGICATGAGDGETALKIWKSMGNRIELGRFGLPDGRYHEVKVRLAQRPLAERNPETEPDDPGLEETIWIERLSPCHGIVRSALFQHLGVDYGDVVLFDGAPITHHKYGEEQVAVFPHLATLVRPGYRIWRFAGTQGEPGQIAELSRDLPDDSVLYVHTEQFQVVCHSCWESGRMNAEHHHDEEHRVVTGKLCAPPHTSPTTLLDRLDELVATTEGIQLLVPDLARETGRADRAEVEARRFAMIES